MTLLQKQSSRLCAHSHLPWHTRVDVCRAEFSYPPPVLLPFPSPCWPSEALHAEFCVLCFQGTLAQPQPWWKSQLFVWEPVLFGTWDGVFTSCMINIFGVVLFLRTGWLVVSDELVALEFLVSL